MNRHFPLGDINPFKYFYIVAAVTGLLFALIAPAGEVSFVLHLVVWQLQAFIPISMIIVAHLLLLKITLFNQQQQWLQLLISGITGSLVFAPLALLIDIYILAEGIPNNLIFELADEAAAVTPPVTIFWLLINLPWLIGFEYQKRAVGTFSDTSKDNKEHAQEQHIPQFLSLTPITNPNDIVSLSAQLHYLEISTTQDKYLILYSLAKAIEEMPESSGMQTHRSHWVAFSHIKEIKPVGRQGEVVTTKATKIPVSRAKLAQVVAQFEQVAAIKKGTNTKC